MSLIPILSSTAGLFPHWMSLRRALLPTIGTAALIVACSPGLATGPEIPSISVEYDAITKAFIAKDFKAFAGFLTDDCVVIGPDKKQASRDQIVKDFTAQRLQLDHVIWTKKVKHQTISRGPDHSPVLHAVAVGHMTAVLNVGDGKSHEFALDASSKDDWVHLAGGGAYWRLKRSETTSFSLKIDGKPASH